MDTAPEPELNYAALEDKYKRALADLENLRKRTNRDIAAARDQSENTAIAEFLPLIDDFKRALDADADGNITHEQAREGWRLVFQKLGGILERLEVQGFDSVGKTFTAEIMEAITQVAMPTLPPGTVVAQVEGGFTRRGRLLRAAKVAVAIAPEEAVREEP